KVAALRQRGDEAAGIARVESISGSKTPPPATRCRDLVPCGRACCQRLDRPRPSMHKTLALLRRPMLELSTLAQVKAVEKRSGIHGDGRLEIVMLERRLERAQVAGDHVRVEGERCGAGHDVAF